MVDGLKLYLQQAGNSIIQSRFYNGWKHDHFVTNIFAFAPNGSIIACTLNAPETWLTEFRQSLQVQSHLEMPGILVQLGHIQRT